MSESADLPYRNGPGNSYCRSTKEESDMATAKQLRIWARTLRQWISEIDDAKTSEQLAEAAVAMERLADHKEPHERQLV